MSCPEPSHCCARHTCNLASRAACCSAAHTAWHKLNKRLSPSLNHQCPSSFPHQRLQLMHPLVRPHSSLPPPLTAALRARCRVPTRRLSSPHHPSAAPLWPPLQPAVALHLHATCALGPLGTDSPPEMNACCGQHLGGRPAEAHTARMLSEPKHLLRGRLQWCAQVGHAAQAHFAGSGACIELSGCALTCLAVGGSLRAVRGGLLFDLRRCWLRPCLRARDDELSVHRSKHDNCACTSAKRVRWTLSHENYICQRIL